MRKIILLTAFISFLLSCRSNQAVTRAESGDVKTRRAIEIIEREELARTERSRIGFERFSNEEGILFALVDVQPTFNGDYTGAEFRDFLMSNVRYPIRALERGISGRVMVGFVIDTDGSIINAHVIQSVHPFLDTEVMRVVMSSPKWTPGIHEGKLVRVKHTIPFIFQSNSMNLQQILERYVINRE